MPQSNLSEPVTWQPYWRFAARAIKRAIYGRRTIRLLDNKFTVAYETRSASYNDDFPLIASLAVGKRCVFDVAQTWASPRLIVASKMSQDGTLYAFDASEACCLVIRENALLNGLQDKIRVVNAVIADTSSSIHSFNWDFVSGNASMVMPLFAGQPMPFYKASLSLDDFTQVTQTVPDFIKVDVEGAELHVLKGMQRIMSTCRPIIWMEFHAWPGVTLSERVGEALEILGSVDYEALDPTSGRPIVDPHELASQNGAAFTRTYALLRPKTGCR